MRYTKMPASLVTACICFGACHCYGSCDCQSKNCSCNDYVCTTNCGPNCNPVV